MPEEREGDAAADAPGPAPPEAPPTISEVETWRETLLFGINSAVAELLPTLTAQKERELAPEVITLFNTSNNRDVLRAAVTYLQELEIPDGHRRARTLLQEWFDRPSDLIIAVIQYLRVTRAELLDDDLAVLLEITRTTPPGRAVSAVRLLASQIDDVQTLIELYNDPAVHEDVQGQILVELGERGDPRAFDFVAEILGEDEDAQTAMQRFAIDTLGKLGDPRALPIILRQLDSPDSLTRAYAVNALTRFDHEDALRGIEMALRDGFWRVRISALQTVASREMTGTIRAVLFMARRDPEQRVRLEALETLASLDQPEGWEFILERFGDERVSTAERIRSIQLAMRANLAESISAVEDVMQREWEKDGSPILDAIGRVAADLENRGIAPITQRLLDHPNFIIQIYGLRSAGRNGLTQFREVVEDRESSGAHHLVRSSARRALEQMDGGGSR